jgi:ribosomal-protein-alanine N-acetyltransferase
LGAEFVLACIEYALKRHNYRGEYVRLGVPAFNRRAITVYERVGFEVFDKVVGEVDGQEFEAVQMRKSIQDPEI